MKAITIGKRVIAVIVVVSFFCFSLYHADRIVKRKDQNGINQFENFYKLDKDSLDVLVVGSSHAYANVNPAVWWREYGFTGYVLGGQAQPVWNSYYAIQEAMKYQNPKVIMFDVYRVAEEREFTDDVNVLENLLGMRPSYLKWQAVKVTVEEEKMLPFFLGYPTYHDRYLSLEKEDCYYFDPSINHLSFKGYQVRFEQYGSEPLNKSADLSLSRDLPPKSLEYFLKIIEFCQEKDIQLVFVNSPFINTSEDDQACFNEIRKIAEQYGIPFLDGDLEWQTIGIDSEKYFADSNHLNYGGSKLYTKYLGDYLAANYTFEDKRNIEAYQSWEWNAVCEEQLEKEEVLASAWDLENYLVFCGENDYHCLVVYDEQTDALEDSVFWQDFIAQEKVDLYYQSDIGQFVTLGDKEGQILEKMLILDDNEYDLEEKVFTAVMYDNILGRIVDVIYSDGSNLYR